MAYTPVIYFSGGGPTHIYFASDAHAFNAMQLVLDKSNHQVHKHYEYWIASSWSEMWSSPERYIWPCPSPPRPDSICGSPVTFSSSLLFRHAAFGFRLRSEQNHSDQIWMMMMITEWWRSSSQTCIMKEEQVGGRTCLAHNSSQNKELLY